jgi:UDP-glucose 4-epimerase
LKVIVTGGAGFIGSHLSEACLAAGHEVTIIDDLSSGHSENVPSAARFEQLDIRSPEAAALVIKTAPDVLIHHAAQMNVRVSVDKPAYDADINVLGFINLLEAARQVGTRRVIFASSGGTVYGEPEQLPCGEDQPLLPVCPYGVSKLAGEQYLYYYSRCHGIGYTALRYANVYGPRQDPHGEAGVVAIFCRKLIAGDDPVIYGDGEQTRDYVYVDDVVRANMAAIEKNYDGGVNIGTGKETSVNYLAERMIISLGSDNTPSHEDARLGEVQRSALDVTLAGKVLDWEPLTSLDEGLVATIEFFRSRS